MSVPGSAAVATPPVAASRASLWGRAGRTLRRDRAGMTGLVIVLVYLAVALGVWLGLWGTGWADVAGGKWEPASAGHWFGTNLIGQDIFQRTVFSVGTAFEVGLMVATVATALGALLGAVAGHFHGRVVDEALLWVMGVLDSIPFYLLVAAVAFALHGNPWAMHVAMVSTFWVATGRLVRGEVIRLRNLEFVEAARAIGVPGSTILFRHLLPNTVHILLVQATLTFVAAIKAEVILSFLGLGLQDGMSWGLMIAESTFEVLSGFFNNFLAASLAMFGLVMAFSVFADALQDALDPRQSA